MTRDDLGHPVAIASPPQRIVCLVPSITEALATDIPHRLVGATDWCTHPQDLQVSRVRGTKNPDLGAISALRPELVIANKEENRELDVRRLRAAGLPVWVTDINSVSQALSSLSRLYAEALHAEDPPWLVAARERWSGPPPQARARVAVAIWRDPWMVVGGNTYTSDLLRHLGWENVFASAKERYPHVDLDEIDRPDVDLVLLPDEPYVFTADDGPEAFQLAATRLVSGRLLTWYGPAMVEAHETLRLEIP